MKKRILMMLLAFVMLAGLMPVMSTPASASASMVGGGMCYFAGETVDFDEINENDFLQVGVIVTTKEEYRTISAGGNHTNLKVSENNVIDDVSDTGFWEVFSADTSWIMLSEAHDTPQFTITWNVDGVKTTEVYKYGATPTHADPTKENTAEYTYTFTGWSPAISTVAGEQTYTAQFSRSVNEYTITFYPNGGTINDGITSYAYGTGATLPSNVTKTGYTFVGWYENSDFSGSSVSSIGTTATGAKTYYAKWTPNKYTITWNVDGVTSTEEYAYGATPEFKGSTDKAADAQYTYTFKGWDAEISEVTGNKTYTATYDETLNEYTITFKNGSEVLQSGRVAYGETPVYSGETPTKEKDDQYSYAFKGWDPEISAVTGNATYTATFNNTVNQYTITFNANGGNAVSPVTQDYNTTVTAPTTTRTGYVLTGWNTHIYGTGTPYAAGSEITVIGDMTLYAQWKHAHCICGAEHASVGSHTAPVITDFANGISSFYELQAAATTGGNYYLTANISININRDAAVDCAIGVQNDMKLCLNGFKITYNGPRELSVFKVNSGKTLNITDCSEDESGEIKVKTEVYNCNGIQNDGTVTIYGGTITSAAYGVMNKGTLTIAGGTVHSTDSSGIGNTPAGTVYVVGGKVTGYNYGIRNGNIFVNGDSLGGGKVYISGGQVSRMYNTMSGQVTVDGTAVVTYILNRAELTVSGGTVNNIKNESDGTATITGGNFPSSSLGAIDNSGTLELSGNPVITGTSDYDIFLSSALTVTGPLSDDPNYQIRISASYEMLSGSNAVVFAKGGADYIDHFDVVNDGYSIVKNGSDLEMVCHKHALCTVPDCSNNHSGDHVNKIFHPVSNKDDLAAAAGTTKNVYLTEDIVLTDTTITVTGKLTLCLNGHSITSTDGKSIFVVNNGTLNLTDCDTTPRIGHLDATTNMWAAGPGDAGETALTLTGGLVTGNTSNRGAVDNNGTFNLYAGNIAGNQCGVYTGNNFNMYGGSIAGNISDGVLNEQGYFTLYGGKITYNNRWGVNNNNTFTMKGGEISYNSGYGVRHEGLTFAMNGGRITHNDRGVYSSGGTQVQGEVIVNENTEADMYLTRNNRIHVMGPLTGNAQIGITLETVVGPFADGLVDMSGYIPYFHSDGDSKVLAEGQQLMLGYTVDEQPTAENKYTVTVSHPDGAAYQWYKLDIQEAVVTDRNCSDASGWYDNYDAATGWTAVYDDDYGICYFKVDMTPDDVLTVTCSGPVTGELKVMDVGSDSSYNMTQEGDTYTFIATYSEAYLLYYEPAAGEDAPTVKATLTHVDEEAVNGQTEAALKTGGLGSGTYFCKVTWDMGTPDDPSDDYSLTSESVDYARPTYTVTVKNGEDSNGTVSVSKTRATSGSTVKITVTPDAYYSVDKVIVSGTNGKEIAVTMNDDGTYSFKMPSRKVTVEAVFVRENTFVDVSEDAFYYDAVQWAVANDITEGTSETTFSPLAACTRAQMVTFLWRAVGSPEPTAADCPFADVDLDSYYGKAIMWAVEKGLIKGTSATTFDPDTECSRAQMATFLCRMAGGEAESDTVAFTDVKADAYYAESVQWAVENGITNGTGDNKFSPDAACTRGQMVTFLYRYYES